MIERLLSFCSRLSSLLCSLIDSNLIVEQTDAGLNGSRGRFRLEMENTEMEKSWDVSVNVLRKRSVSSFSLASQEGKCNCQATVHEKAVIHSHMGAPYSPSSGEFPQSLDCVRENIFPLQSCLIDSYFLLCRS